MLLLLSLMLSATPGPIGSKSEGAAALPPVVLETGDLIFHRSASRQSQAIQLATHSPWSHVGVVFVGPKQILVLEASTTVRFTPLSTFVARGQGGHYQVWRRADRATGLRPKEVERLWKEGRRTVGITYDWAFGWDDQRLYCSELAHKLYQRAFGMTLVEPRPLSEYDLTHPAVQAKLQERYGDDLPLEEPVVAPADLLTAPGLVMVAEG